MENTASAAYLADVVRQFAHCRVLLVGDAMLDSYLEGTATRLCSEAPVPVVRAQQKVYLPGGAANTAVNVSSLGAEVHLLAVVGSDHAGQVLRTELERRGVSTTHVIEDAARRTTSKLRVIADSQYVVRFDEEDTEDLKGWVEEELITRFRELFDWSDVLIVSDYLKGVVTPRLVAEIGRLNRRYGKLVVVDSKDLTRRRFCNVSVITPNHMEAQQASDIWVDLPGGADLPGQLEAVGKQLLESIATRWVIMTMGKSGALLFERGQAATWIPPYHVQSTHGVGAGDSFTACLALALAAGAPIRLAAQVASTAASVAVGKERVAAVLHDELLAAVKTLLPSGEMNGDVRKAALTYSRGW